MKEPTRDDSGLQASEGMEEQALQDVRRVTCRNGGKRGSAHPTLFTHDLCS